MSIGLNNVIQRLSEVYGPVARPDQAPEPVDELIQTILSQNTSDTNTARAFASLKATYPDWALVINSPVADVVEAIKIGGLAEQKAPRIQAVLRQVITERGNLDLHFLADLPLPEAMRWLTGLPGVGPKTAACALLFSLDVPVMPVDTHVHRVALRLELIPTGTSADKAHSLLGKWKDAADAYQAHMLLIRHGRITCRARSPRCSECVLNSDCPSAQLFDR